MSIPLDKPPKLHAKHVLGHSPNTNLNVTSALQPFLDLVGSCLILLHLATLSLSHIGVHYTTLPMALANCQQLLDIVGSQAGL